ncbi:hypothetical protein Tco_0900040 [Tanacetum coccineum]
MSEGGGDIDDNLKNNVADAVQQTTKLNDATPRNSGDFNEDNVIIPNDSQDQLMQMVVELKFQNEYLKSHFQDLKDVYTDSAGSSVQAKEVDHDSKELKDKIEALNEELVIERQTRGAAEAALEHLRAEYTEADAKSQELEAKLAEAQKNLEQQVKERDEKNSELDSKKTPLIEISLLIRDNIKELRHSMEPKENAIETLQQSLLEKEQVLENMRGLLQAAEEKRQASLAELSSKHQQQIADLEAQLAESAADRTKATETISSLQSDMASFLMDE